MSAGRSPPSTRAYWPTCSRPRGPSPARGDRLDDFLDAVTAPGGLWPLVADYWRDHRLAADADFVARVGGTLARSRAHLAAAVDEVRRDFQRYLADVVLHSLEQGLRNLFLIEGSTRDDEVGAHAVLWLTHGRPPADARRAGWLVLDGAARPANDLARALADAGVERRGEFVTFAAGQPPRFRSLWQAGVRP